MLTPGERWTVLTGWMAIAASELALGRALSPNTSLSGAVAETVTLVGLGCLHAWLANIRALRGPFAPLGWAAALGMLMAAAGPLRLPAAMGVGLFAVFLGVVGHLLEERSPRAAAPLAILVAPLAVLARVVMEVWYAGHGDLAVSLAATAESAIWLAPLVLAAAAAAWDPRAGVGVLAGAPLLALDPHDPPPPQRSDSIILITVDTLRADAGAEMESVQRLAQQGTLYTNAAAASSWTLPSLASLHTGLLPNSHEAGRVGTTWLELRAVRPDAVTLAEYLGPEGLTRGAVVSNPLVGHGLEQGFESWTNLSLQAPMRPIGLGLAGRNLDLTSFGDPASAERVVDGALRWLDHAPAGDVFLWVHLLDPHLPYHRSAEWSDLDVRDLRQDGLRPTSRASVRAAYDAEVAATDQAILRLLDGLDARGLQHATVVMTSDHGEEFWEHGGVEHGHAFVDEVVRVPLVIRYGTTRQGDVHAGPVSLIDVFPSLLADRGWAPVPDQDGVVFGARTGPRQAHGTLYGANRDATLTRPLRETVVDDGADGAPSEGLRALGYVE